MVHCKFLLCVRVVTALIAVNELSSSSLLYSGLVIVSTVTRTSCNAQFVNFALKIASFDDLLPVLTVTKVS